MPEAVTTLILPPELTQRTLPKLFREGAFSLVSSAPGCVSTAHSLFSGQPRTAAAVFADVGSATGDVCGKKTPEAAKDALAEGEAVEAVSRKEPCVAEKGDVATAPTAADAVEEGEAAVAFRAHQAGVSIPPMSGDDMGDVATQEGRYRNAVSGELKTAPGGSASATVRGGECASGENVLVIDASGVRQCDSAGAAAVWNLCHKVVASGGTYALQGAPETLVRALKSYAAAVASAAKSAETSAQQPEKSDWLTALGRQVCAAFSRMGAALAFLGEVIFGLRFVCSRRFRMGDALLAFVRSGAEAVPVVALIGFLLGLILAFQSAVPLQMFGAEGFVGGLVGIALVRELGLILTAILMAGRTASAFAAELGTMKVNEEIDALETMGIAPVRFLVVPRVLAGTAALPILSLFATASGLLGGWLVMHILGFSVTYFIDQLQSFVALKDLIGSECKAVIFGFMVSTVGCWFGLQAGRDAGAVGTATTAAVVTSIVLLATLEGLFSVVFYAMGW